MCGGGGWNLQQGAEKSSKFFEVTLRSLLGRIRRSHRCCRKDGFSRTPATGVASEVHTCKQKLFTSSHLADAEGEKRTNTATVGSVNKPVAIATADFYSGDVRRQLCAGHQHQ